MNPSISIIAPMFNEAAELPRFQRMIARLTPAPVEMIVVDGGGADGSAALARSLGLTVVSSDR